ILRRRLHGTARLNAPPTYLALPPAKLHRDLVRAVRSTGFAHPIRIGSLAIAVDVIGIETTLVRHGDNQNAVAIDVDVTRGRPTPEEVHRLQAVHFVTTRVQSDLHRWCRCWRRRRCERCRRSWRGCERCRRSGRRRECCRRSCRWRWCWTSSLTISQPVARIDYHLSPISALRRVTTDVSGDTS